MAEHIVDPALFVPPSTQENYLDAARAAAKANGTDLADEWASMVDTFKRNHDQDGASGWNHLAAWAESVDPTAAAGPDPVEVRKARELSTAIQDPASVEGPALDLADDEVASEVRHAHDAIARRSRAPMTVDEEDEDGEEREDGRPRRTATPPRKTTR
jgi:hypothetical protein